MLDGIAIFEIGSTQHDAVAALAQNQGLESTLRRDLNGHPRAMIMSQGVGKGKANR